MRMLDIVIALSVTIVPPAVACSGMRHIPTVRTPKAKPKTDTNQPKADSKTPPTAKPADVVKSKKSKKSKDAEKTPDKISASR